MPFREAKFKVETADGRHCTLLDPVTYFALNGEEITIPAGATTDGISTAPDLPGWRAAVLHDYLYRYTTRPKEECDALFYEALLGMSVPDATAKIMYAAVSRYATRAFTNDRNLTP